jgi:hypothetical protein
LLKKGYCENYEVSTAKNSQPIIFFLKLIPNYTENMINDVLFEISGYLDFYEWVIFSSLSKYTNELFEKEKDKKSHIRMMSPNDAKRGIFTSIEVEVDLYLTLDFHDPCFRYVRNIRIPFRKSLTQQKISVPRNLNIERIFAPGCEITDDLYDTDIIEVQAWNVRKLPRNIEAFYVFDAHDFHYIEQEVPCVGCIPKSVNLPVCEMMVIFSSSLTEEEFYRAKSKVLDVLVLACIAYDGILNCDFTGLKAIIIATDVILPSTEVLIETLREIYGPEKELDASFDVANNRKSLEGVYLW